MSSLRWLIAVLLLGAAAFPLMLTLLEAARSGWAPSGRELGRILELAGRTTALASLTLVVALPLGTLLAILLNRSDLPARSFFRGLLLVSMFVPLPLFASAWQAAFGTGGWLTGGGWLPWDQGLVPAAMIHALASLPWVVWIVGQGIAAVEPELEEDALQVLPAWRVLWHVSFRRVRPAFAVAALWIIVQTVCEIAITDVMQVRTFAEEVYTQFVLGGGLSAAVLLSLPQVILLGVVAVGVVGRWQDRSPPLLSWPNGQPLVRMGRARWAYFHGVLLTLALLAGVPIASLIWKTGGGAQWSATHFVDEIGRVATTSHRVLFDSLLWSVVAGVIAAGLAMAACWLGRDAAWFRTGLVVLTIALWVVPGPVLGYGVKEAIGRLIDLDDGLLGSTRFRPLATVLYYEPTPLPVMWVHVLRIFPFAMALMWQAVRSVPRDLIEAARVDGAGPLREFRFVIWPLARSMFLRALLVGSVLALGELSASKMVEIPGRRTIAQELFNQMHYGVTSTIAALCLMQLAAVTLLAMLLLVVGGGPHRPACTSSQHARMLTS